MRLALFQPDMPQNTGTMLRLGACVDVEVDIIEPCGFVFDERALRRYGMDYLELVKYPPQFVGRLLQLCLRASGRIRPDYPADHQIAAALLQF